MVDLLLALEQPDSELMSLMLMTTDPDLIGVSTKEKYLKVVCVS